MTLIGSITIPKTSWLLICAGLLAILLTLLFWSYRRAHAINPGNKAAFFLKLLALLVLALCLLEPLWSGNRAVPGANIFVIMADNSSSMNIIDSGTTQKRADILRATTDANNSKWLTMMAEDFQVRQYLFDSRIRRTMDFSELSFDGKTSSISTALKTVAERYGGKPVAGVILLSDGCSTDINQSYDFSNLPPVYPVVIGGSRPQKDISINNVSISQSAFEDAPVKIQADIETSGYSGKNIRVDLTDDSGQLVESQIYNIGTREDKKVFKFRLRPEETGILFYNLAAKEQLDEESSTQSNAAGEATMVNNNRTIVVDRGGGPYRVLYVTGRPNWEYKFLRRAIIEDEQVRLLALIRVARREPKFNWIGRRGERSNPLFRGFDNIDEEQTEQYDQPVLIRMDPLGWEDPTELRDGFPTTEEELYRYHAIIIDDIEAEFFSPTQMDLIRRFVSERGGGFLMLGGKESFQKSNYNRTAIGQILPIHLDRLPDRPTAGKLYLDLTREGWLQPWARLRENETEEKQRISEMPAFRVLNRLPSVKPGASTVAIIANEWSQQFPALTVQRYGNGRTGALTIGDLWRWGLRESQMHEDMDKFWRQILRWLIADVPERISLQAVNKQDETNQPVVLQVRVRDEKFEPLDNVSVAVEICDPLEQITKLTAEPVFDESGLYKATYIPHSNGGYLARATVTDTNNTELDSSQTGWTCELDAQEFRSVKVNRSLLENVAQRTGGRIVEIDELEKFARDLPGQKVPIAETWIRPLWDVRWISLVSFLFILICLLGEWILRRWKGMP
ncbi:MAG: hypothetical protein JW715_13280 [Sedimentisphaerales bacterium]|nr:hypothetical protein [Sedimentisphaerales bacterium]